ncbi:MAG: hypothetical protein GY746_10870 [Gammaproteobacteria bacterium]|nr:hypothetical protein [Gammaproteobacteria bacterium]
MNDEQLNNIMTEAEDSLVNGEYKQAAEAFEQIANCFAGIGDIDSFFNLRKHIVDMAKARTNAIFIDEQLKTIERERQSERIRITVN